MADFNLQFDTLAFTSLDEFALLACQSYNYGNATDWFGNFRGGLYGFYARQLGVATHYHQVHAWVPRPRFPTETEYHLSSIFFNLDSSLECLTFAFNALGSAVRPGEFRDVTDSKALKRITPKDILGEPNATPPREPLSGYKAIFPSVVALWQARVTLIERIIEQHDVSKHRSTIFTGGQTRADPPAGFYELAGVPDDPLRRAIFAPMAEIILKNDLKAPRVSRPVQALSDTILLETVATEFVTLVRDTGVAVLADVEANIPLAVKSFPQT